MLDGIKLFSKYDAVLTKYVVSLICPVGLMLVLAVNYSGLSLACGDSFIVVDEVYNDERIFYRSAQLICIAIQPSGWTLLKSAEG